MRLHGLCYYRSKSDAWPGDWRNSDYSARNIVKAIKHEDFNGYSNLIAGSVKVRIDNTIQGRTIALDIVSTALSRKIKSAGYEQVAIVPIPSSSHIDPVGMFTGRRLAEAIQAKEPSFVSSPILYFDEVLPKSAGGGGTRNPHTIKEHLRLAGCEIPHPIVLLDDVYTSGGHMIAAARFFYEIGVQIDDAFVIGRTAWSKPDKMFNVLTEEIETTDPF